MQQTLFPNHAEVNGLHGTFAPNYKSSVHRWFPYVEGFSSEFVQTLIDEFGDSQCRIYDPFAGTGTTITVAAANGAIAYYSEINPLMRLVIECKTNSLRHVSRRHAELSRYLSKVAHKASICVPSSEEARLEQAKVFGDREYFKGTRLVEIVAIKRAIESVKSPSPAFLDMARLAMAAIAVKSSEMKRAADLRYRTEKEFHQPDFSPLKHFDDKLSHILNDIDESFSDLPAATCLSESCLSTPTAKHNIDLLITSPPYLNGTNYFRNTKLELWLTGFLTSESQLGDYRTQAMAAGINNISARGRAPEPIESVEQIATQLDEVAYDKRIPELVRRYFSDSCTWLKNAHRLVRPGGHAIIDIGDSRFAGVHVPTDRLLGEVAEGCGFKLAETRLVRTRKSKDGSALQQVLLVLQKPPQRKNALKRSLVVDTFLDEAVKFGRELPHLAPPYSSRNWGHNLHSLCSYQGKLKPAITHFLVDRFSEPGERVLDPLSGCGTVPLEAFLQGRVAIGNDLQELAHILTMSKVKWGDVDKALEWQDQLLEYVRHESGNQSPDSYSDFGLNGKIPEYFHKDTYCELLAARKFIQRHPCECWEQAVVYSCLLHILHGNRPYALSRRSHPVTPFKPTGETEYRPLAPRLKDKLNRTLSVAIPKNAKCGMATLSSYTELRYRHSVDVVITSPPFAQSTRFFSSNWMRLWFAGWEPTDFKARPEDFIERQQKKSMNVYKKFFQHCKRWLRPEGRLIMHLGKTSKCNMAQELAELSGDLFEVVYSFDEDVAGREKFGIRDQGATTSHQYVFMRVR